jgi:hypothetical protein
VFQRHPYVVHTSLALSCGKKGSPVIPSISYRVLIRTYLVDGTGSSQNNQPERACLLLPFERDCRAAASRQGGESKGAASANIGITSYADKDGGNIVSGLVIRALYETTLVLRIRRLSTVVWGEKVLVAGLDELAYEVVNVFSRAFRTSYIRSMTSRERLVNIILLPFLTIFNTCIGRSCVMELCVILHVRFIHLTPGSSYTQ